MDITYSSCNDNDTTKYLKYLTNISESTHDWFYEIMYYHIISMSSTVWDLNQFN